RDLAFKAGLQTGLHELAFKTPLLRQILFPLIAQRFTEAMKRNQSWPICSLGQIEANTRARQASSKADRRAVRAPACGPRQRAVGMELDRIHATGDRRHRDNVVT